MNIRRIKNWHMNEEQWPDIIEGALKNSLSDVEAALKADSDSINQQEDETGSTALHIAVASMNMPMVLLLSSQVGADINIKDDFGRDVIDLALEVGHPEIVKHLLKLRGSQIEGEPTGGKILPFKPD
ncbi:MAG: ankyrin repeat domain-containing protein [Rhizobiales bacterium]|nr:ankyrin repeat domain-containing protein [Hyphomicrobiales bacterium]